MVRSAERSGDDKGEVLRQAKALIALAELLPPTVEDVAPPMSDVVGLLIYDILNQKTVGTTARGVFSGLQQRFPRWAELAAAPAEDVEETIRSDGMASRRASRIQQLVRRVLADFPNGAFEALDDWDDSAIRAYLMTLPAVGEPTAQHVLLYAFDRPVLPVTWTLKRLLARLGLSDRGVNPEEIFVAAAALLSPGNHRSLFEQLTTVARLYCRPRAPRCQQCPLTEKCAYFRRHHGPLLLKNPHANRRPGRRAQKPLA